MQRKLYNLRMNHGMQAKIGLYHLCMNNALLYFEFLDRVSQELLGVKFSHHKNQEDHGPPHAHSNTFYNSIAITF